MSMTRILAAILATFLGLAGPAAAARTITDSAGRQVAVPDHVTRVFAAGPPATVLVYALAPQTLAGWTRGDPGRTRVSRRPLRRPA
jgi:iron complex transport system substrate-binding protein